MGLVDVHRNADIINNPLQSSLQLPINTGVQVGFDALRRRRQKWVLHLLSETDDGRNDGRQINC